MEKTLNKHCELGSRCKVGVQELFSDSVLADGSAGDKCCSMGAVIHLKTCLGCTHSSVVKVYPINNRPEVFLLCGFIMDAHIKLEAQTQIVLKKFLALIV